MLKCMYMHVFLLCTNIIDFRKLAVLCASRGKLDASIKLLECLSECGALQTGILTTTTHLILNHIVSHCKVRTAIQYRIYASLFILCIMHYKEIFVFGSSNYRIAQILVGLILVDEA